MFYSQSLLSNKGALGTIWLAAYCSKKLKKEQIVRTNISSSVDKIIPEVQISYRILAQLLLGVVRIFSKKVDFLYHDCNEALSRFCKILNPRSRHVLKKVVSAPSRGKPVTEEAVHLTESTIAATGTDDKAFDAQYDVSSPKESMLAPYHNVTITIPENFALDSFDLEVPEEGDSVNANRQFTIEGEEEDDRHFFLNEYTHKDAVHDLGFNDVCFTPVADIISNFMMDIDLQINDQRSSTILESREEPQSDLAHIKEQKHENIPRAKKSLSLKMNDKEKEEAEHQINLRKLQKSLELDIRRTPARTHDKASVPCASGASSPDFTVTTPAKRERRFTRKRKCNSDETIVMSNQALREGIHNSSNLICKRRKAPHTFLDAWKAYKFSDLQKAFLEPLIPHTGLQFRDYSIKKSSNIELEVSTVNKFDYIQSEGLNSSDRKTPFHENTLHIPGSGSYVETPADINLDGHCKEPSAWESSSGLKADLDICSIEEDTRYQGGFSIRTRSVAQYLCKSLSNQKEREKEESLSLAKILYGRKRTECARFFYETLVLKTQGCIDIMQDFPYADITISATPKLRQSM